jgi:predicted aldo/keto reductase-like oxidoreductase
MMQTTSSIPLKKFGKTSVSISALGLGGHHLGAAQDEQTAVSIVHRAIEGGSPSLTVVGNTTEANQKTGSARALRDRETKCS